ncbi:acyltransferase [Leuconostoc gasicomitatum]|uniref:acyltransferase n=1 Tax=Leuconostoc gasicomitatum TaxID=115778 RepID=UPI001CC424F6|nr:acyltransferase [Leuconostoc gasicomitatum]MBZ5946337.1 acyltransferase [Leuconostoc gasicomitatum]MBZ5950162.1 acyltransferase [Leuconostoc gasicomitatum]
MDFKKIIWMARAFFLKPYFGSIGNLSYIGKPISLLNKKNIFLGRNVHIYPNARIETYQDGKIKIEDDVSISENVHIVSAGGTLVIGKGTLIGPNVFISNSDHEYRDVKQNIVNQPLICKEVVIGSENYIGTGVAILPGTSTGIHTIIGAHAVVSKKYGSYNVIVGTPGKVVKTYDTNTKKWK